VALLTKPDAVILTLLVMGIAWFLIMNIVVPRVMSQAVGVHPVVVLVSVLIGLKVAGIAGAIFSVPFAAVIAAFFHHFLSRNAHVPRDVTTMAAKRVGEREGRVVRVPQPPRVRVAGSAVPADRSEDASETSAGSAAARPPKPKPKPAEPTA
jgi:membrane protein implicated in regulation of membrane protease activity